MALEGHWFGLYTKPHNEYAVRDYLSGRQVEVYLPEVCNNTQRRGRRGRMPFFPHYLFARLDLRDGIMAKVPWTPGLRRFVTFAGEPAPVPDAVVAHIRRELAHIRRELANTVEADPDEPFKKGEVVRIPRGPLEGPAAVFDRRLSDDGRVRVFLQCMDRLMAAELDLDDLLPAG